MPRYRPFIWVEGLKMGEAAGTLTPVWVAGLPVSIGCTTRMWCEGGPPEVLSPGDPGYRVGHGSASAARARATSAAVRRTPSLAAALARACSGVLAPGMTADTAGWARQY